MKWLKLIIFFILLLLGIYSISMIFVEKYQSFYVKKEVNFPLEKVYAQFYNMQNFSQWNEFVTNNKNLSYTYFTPYEGVGSSMHFVNKKDSAENGDIFLRYEIPHKGLKFQMFRNNDTNPYLIDVSFKSINQDKTEITWFVRTPARSFMTRSLNLLYEENFNTGVDQSMVSLQNVLGNKVDREAKLNAIKYDTIMTENREGGVLLGLNTSSSNRKKGDFYNSVMLDYNKLYAFLTRDLDKKADEFGEPQLVMRANTINDKDITYFYGVMVNKKFGITDNNFNFRTISPAKVLVAYYKGSYDGRKVIIGKLMQEAKKQNLTTGDITEMFIQPPIENENVILKLSLQVY